MIRWLEVSADYRCNNRCVGCFSVQDDGPRMATSEVFAHLRFGRAQGADALWLGGGDPTLRRDLEAIVREARRLGYTRVKLQTNGMMLAYPEYVDRLVAAGLTEVNFAIKGASAQEHDRWTRTPGCHALLLKGIAEARARGLPLEGDILVYRSNAPALPEMVRFYAALGIPHFNLWLLAAEPADPESGAEVPRISDIVPFLTAAMDLGVATVTSLHTPPCTVPPGHHACLFFAPDLALVVVNPGGHRFRLEESPIEGGVFLDRCGRCRMRARCGGLRRTYLERYGDGEFQPIEG
jgi:MoaA/NifB/PqqE/SkfB family radical SAM enzyme